MNDIKTIAIATLFFVAIAIVIPAIWKSGPSIKVEFRLEVNRETTSNSY